MQDSKRDGGRAWLITFLLFVAQTINYFDKSVIGLAAPALMQDLGLSRQQYGWIASAFFSLYALSGILVGLLVAHRVRAKTLLTILVLIWSVSQLPIYFTSSVAVLIACRVMLGIGEGPANATAISACHEWFTNKNRNMPTAVLMIGSSVGSLLSAPLLSFVIEAYGWRSAFLACSGLGLVWVVLWQLLGANGPADTSQAEVATREVAGDAPATALSLRHAWLDPTIVATIVVAFCAYWIAAFTVSWVAPFIRDALLFDALQTGWLVAAVSSTASVAIMVVSYLSQRLLKSGVSSRHARGTLIGICMLLGGAALLAATMVESASAKLVCIAIGSALPMLTFTLGPTLVSEIVPTAYRARMLIVIFSGVTIAGFFSPSVSGYLIGSGGIAGYNRALIANAALTILGGIIGVFLLRPERTMRRFTTLMNSAPLRGTAGA